jgi:hypothetical protein
MDAIHRILTGQALTLGQLRFGGAVVLVWIGVIQFIEMVIGWFR